MEVIVNGQKRTAPAGMTIEDLLRELGFTGRPVAVEVNEQVVPKREHRDHALNDRDRIELVTLVGGG
ncbi:MAG: sulfur carrier protein ThiS [Phycisphaerales bacterium]